MQLETSDDHARAMRADAIRALKQQDGANVVTFGSGETVRQLLAAGLVDDLRLLIYPVMLGRGKRLFPDGINRLKLKLVESKSVGPDGVLVQIYQRA